MLTFLGGGRGCAGALTRPSTRHLLPKNFEKTALRKRVGIFTVKMRGGHIYGNYCTNRAKLCSIDYIAGEMSPSIPAPSSMAECAPCKHITSGPATLIGVYDLYQVWKQLKIKH